MPLEPASTLRRAAWRIASLAALGAMATTAVAATPQAEIAMRQDNYKKMGQAMKVLNDQLKIATPDKVAMVGAARVLSATARLQGALFPAGSGPVAGQRTDALPAVWTQRPAFDAAMNRMVVEAGKLLTVAGSGDAAAIRLQTKATGATCAACHREFRADN